MTDSSVPDKARYLSGVFEQLQAQSFVPPGMSNLRAHELARLVPDLLAVIDGQEQVLRRVAWLTAADELHELPDTVLIPVWQIREALNGKETDHG